MKQLLFSIVLIAALLSPLAAASSLAANVATIAGTVGSGYSGDGGPAIAAQLGSPYGMAVAADGTVYVADSVNYRVRRIGTNGIIDTIAGNGSFGDDGDGGPATSASLSGVLSIALSPADDILYISDIDNNRVRQVNLTTGVITNFAGAGYMGFGFDGDGGPATSASLAVPEGVAVDAAGNVYIGDLFNCVVRRVDASTNIITTVAGIPGHCTPGGDGGDALSAQFSLPRRMALDAAGNLFVLDSGSRTVRRIDAATNIITTIAGGGAVTPGFGDATTMDIGAPSDLVLDAANNLYIATFNQVLKVDLDTGILSVFAGTGVTGFSGDGGPAQDATFYDIGGVTRRGDEILIADSGNARIRAVVPPAPPPDDLIIELTTSQALLDSITAVPGSVLMINVDGREYLILPNAASVGLDVTLTDNDQLIVIDLTALANAGGDITISGNLTLQSVDLSDLTTVGGSLSITNNPALNAILISGVTSIGGDLTVIGTAATVIDVSALTTVTGSLDISGNTSATVIDMSSLSTVTGSLDVSGNTSATTIDMSSVASVGGDLIITYNDTATAIDMSSLSTVTGSLDISGNTSATAIDMSSVASVGGDLIIADNTAATTLDAASLATVGGDLILSGNTSVDVIGISGVTSVGGDLTIVDNGGAAVDMSAGTDVTGSLTVETTGTGSFPMGDGTVTGDLTLDATGYTDMSGATPVGSLDLTSTNLEAMMRLQVQSASFTTPVAFSVTRVDPVALVPESGVDAGGAPATIDPIAAYQFTFAVPTLNRDAALSFDIDLAQLDAATRTALLDALAAGTATIVTKGDAAGSVFQAFPICAGAQVPTADGCVRVETFDALGQPTSGTPAIVRFSNVVGHFSTWAVAVVDDDTTLPDTAIDSGPVNPANSAAATFTFHGSDDGTPAASLTFECALDGGSFSACASPTALTGLADGSHTFEARATDGAGNLDPTPAGYSWVVDTTPPTLNPVVSPNPVILNGSASVASGAADALSGLASQSCDALDTSSVGTKSVTCYAMDHAGNTNSASTSYTVTYNFTGFFSPVDNLPTLNRVKAGRAIPIRFSLNGYQGLNIFAAGYPRSGPIACGSDALVEGIEETTSIGSRNLIYNPLTGKYIYLWKTQKSWAGTCRQFVLKLIDGTLHRANFKFK